MYGFTTKKRVCAQILATGLQLCFADKNGDGDLNDDAEGCIGRLFFMHNKKNKRISRGGDSGGPIFNNSKARGIMKSTGCDGDDCTKDDYGWRCTGPDCYQFAIGTSIEPLMINTSQQNLTLIYAP